MTSGGESATLLFFGTSEARGKEALKCDGSQMRPWDLLRPTRNMAVANVSCELSGKVSCFSREQRHRRMEIMKGQWYHLDYAMQRRRCLQA